MAFNLKQALEFNKFTTGLAAAGFAFAATIGGETSIGALPTSIWVKAISTFALLSFAASVLVGTLIMGRAATIEIKESDLTNDPLMRSLGKAHSIALFLGLMLASALMLNRVWKLV